MMEKYITAGIIKNLDPPTKEKFAKLRAIAEKKEEQEKKKKKKKSGNSQYDTPKMVHRSTDRIRLSEKTE